VKCIKRRGSEVERISDQEAHKKFRNGWDYVPKSEYKDQENPDVVSCIKVPFYPGRIYDANDKELFEPYWANLRTGEARHHKRDADGEFLIVENDLMEEVIMHPAPLRFERTS